MSMLYKPVSVWNSMKFRWWYEYVPDISLASLNCEPNWSQHFILIFVGKKWPIRWILWKQKTSDNINEYIFCDRNIDESLFGFETSSLFNQINLQPMYVEFYSKYEFDMKLNKTIWIRFFCHFPKFYCDIN